MNPNTLPMQQTWDKIYQVTHHKIPVYPAVSNFRLAKGLQQGDTVNRQYRSTMYARPMGGDGSYRRQSLTDTNQQLAIDQVYETSFYLKELDEIQKHLPTRKAYAMDASKVIFNRIDGQILGNYDSFTSTLDSGDLGGNDGEGITVSTANVRKLFSKSTKKLQRNNIMIDNAAKFTGFKKEDSKRDMGIAVISPDVHEMLLESLDGKDSDLGDRVGIQGHVGRYMGYEIFVSNALGWSGVLDFGSTDFSDGDTVVINGVTLTLKTTLGTTAGNVKIGGTVADSIDALVAAINDAEGLEADSDGNNGEGTVGTDYVELSQADRDALRNITATDGTTSLSLKAEGYGYVVVDETATPGDILWTTTTQVQHCLIGIANSIDAVIQKTPNMRVQGRTGYVGVDVVTWAAWGSKVFQESVVKMVDVQVRTDAYS